MIQFTYSPVWLIGCFAVAALYSAALYAFRPLFTDYRRWILSVFRFIVVFILCVLLLKPVLEYLNVKAEKPTIVLGLDNSLSMLSTNDSATERSTLIALVEKLKTEFSDDFSVQLYAFGHGIDQTDTFSFSDKLSDLSAFLNYTANAYEGRNLGAVIMISDGLYNRGIGPEYTAGTLPFPVHTIRAGDTAQIMDLRIEDVRYNRLTFSGATTPVKVTISGRGVAAGVVARLRLLQDGKAIDQREFEISETTPVQQIDFELEAGEAGIHAMELRLDTVVGEVDNRNNRRVVYMEVLDGKRNILVLSAFPHPDAGAIYSALGKLDQYEVTLLYASQAEQVQIGTALQRADAVVLYQISAVGEGASLFLDAINLRRIPVMYVLGSRSQPNLLNRWDLPFEYAKLRGGIQEVLPYPADNFNLFSLPARAIANLDNLPSMLSLFDVPALKGEQFQILKRKIGTVETSAALWSIGVDNGQRYAVILGEGLWKWRLRELYNSDFNQEIFVDAALQKSIQFISGREQRKRLRVETEPEWEESEPVLIHGELYTPTYEKLPDQEISLTLWNKDRVIYESTMTPAGENYLRDIRGLKSGVYGYLAQSDIFGTTLRDSGVFVINESILEYGVRAADHGLLQRISQITSGVSVDISAVDALIDLIRSEPPKTILREEITFRDVTDLQWVFWLLILLLGTEWAIRRFSGMV
ncbi:MAG: hypothetical protein KDC37_00335 [Flavobacteriales bacterium]|nr:hypothetical protein [Flavobacteriales bacterium]